jgi:hypothetical protein
MQKYWPFECFLDTDTDNLIYLYHNWLFFHSFVFLIMSCVKIVQLAVSSGSSYFTCCSCQKGSITVCGGPSRTCNLHMIFEHVCHRIIVSTSVHLLNCALNIYQPATTFPHWIICPRNSKKWLFWSFKYVPAAVPSICFWRLVCDNLRSPIKIPFYLVSPIVFSFRAHAFFYLDVSIFKVTPFLCLNDEFCLSRC